MKGNVSLHVIDSPEADVYADSEIDYTMQLLLRCCAVNVELVAMICLQYTPVDAMQPCEITHFAPCVTRFYFASIHVET